MTDDRLPDEAPRSRWDEEDRALLRALGARVSQIIHGEEVDLPDLQRRDELGILANMVNRLARELGAARRREREREHEHEQRTGQIEAAYRTQEKLLTVLRELSAPILEPQRGVVLVPLHGGLTDGRLPAAIPAVLERIAAARPRAIILHLTEPDDAPRSMGDPPSTAPFHLTLWRQIERLARPLGARVILSGWPPESRRQLSPDVDGALSYPSACADLDEALAVAAEHVGQRITR